MRYLRALIKKLVDNKPIISVIERFYKLRTNTYSWVSTKIEKATIAAQSNRNIIMKITTAFSERFAKIFCRSTLSVFFRKVAKIRLNSAELP